MPRLNRKYSRSKFDDFNKVSVSCILNLFHQYFDQQKHRISWLRKINKPSQYGPLVNWFFSFPRTKLRSQQMIRLAFIHNYKYNQENGTQIPALGKNNQIFNDFKQLENNPDIGIEKINQDRVKLRQVLKLVPFVALKCYLTKKNTRGIKLKRTTRKQIPDDLIDDYYFKLWGFYNQLTDERQKPQIVIINDDSASLHPEEWSEYNSDDEELKEIKNQISSSMAMGLSPFPQINSSSTYNIKPSCMSLQMEYILTPPQSVRADSFHLSEFQKELDLEQKCLYEQKVAIQQNLMRKAKSSDSASSVSICGSYNFYNNSLQEEQQKFNILLFKNRQQDYESNFLLDS